MKTRNPKSEIRNPICLVGRVIRAGRAEGRALVSPQPISFLGGVDPETGTVIEPGHPLEGQCIAGRVLVFPGGKGSTVGSYTILRLARNGCAPAAMINARSEAIVAVGAILADIPMVDNIDITQIRSGDWVTVDRQRVEIRRTASSKLQTSNFRIQRPREVQRLDGEALHSEPPSGCGLPIVDCGRRNPKSEIRNPKSTELVFLKLGGSLITDKTREATARPEVIRRLAGEVAEALAACPGLRLLLGHGSGSFGHVVGQRYGTRHGVRSAADWRGFAETAVAAARLNRLVTDVFWQAGVPVWSVQPSASAHCRDGKLVDMDWHPVSEALEHGLVPLVYGDVALDEVRGGTIISTEEIFAWLARRLKPDRIVLAGVVPGVMSADPHQADKAQVIAEIVPEQLTELAAVLSGAHGTDVTGGMLAKVRTMCVLVGELPGLEVRLISGEVAGLLAQLLCDPSMEVGTVIRARRP